MSDADNQDPDLQFKLWHVFYLVGLFSVSFSLGVSLLVVAVLWFATCATAAAYPTRAQRISSFLSIGSLGGIMLVCSWGWFLPIGSIRPDLDRTTCMHNMRAAMRALWDYELAKGHFPDTSSQPSGDQPPHSWRVAILPWIGEQKLFDQYDFDKSWDSPVNSKLLDKMPAVYRCPCLNCDENMTSYKLVTGPGTIFDGQGATLRRISDGTSNTIGLVEDSVDPIEWTRPSDLTIEQAVELIQRTQPPELPHVFGNKFQKTYSSGNFVAFDGNVQLGVFALEPEGLRQLFQVDDGAEVDLHSAKWHSVKVVKVEPWAAIGGFFLLMLYPFGWVVRRDRPGDGDAGECDENTADV